MTVASGIWDVRTVERQRRINAWPGQFVPDTNFSSVKLLLPFDGSGATFTDSSSNAFAVTANGNVTQSATQSKWGGKSAYFDGSGDYLTFGSADISLGAGDFTVEMWIYPTATQTAFLCDWRGAGNNNPSLYIANSKLNFFNGGSLNVADATAISSNTWTHIAVTRSGSTVRIYRDGNSVGSLTDSGTYGGSGGLRVGFHDNVYFTGYLDDLRITKGVARYTGSTYTVPTAAHPLA